ncbi:PIN domain-containing protein [Candidatus Woesearchaeota archaeon]|nr:PIN domain-containing protein [Candidatus Woesearchaeota archaeon]
MYCLTAMDGLIFATALEAGAELVTADSDFAGMQRVVMV